MTDVRGEIALWRAVLLRALEDGEGVGQCIPHGAGQQVRSDATAFLTASSGSWAQARRRICDLAQVEPEAFERLACARLVQREAAPPAPKHPLIVRRRAA
jgi:hypothetical protein